MKESYFFAYCSLVNRNTHQYADCSLARLHGWRRVWRHTNLRPIAYLTVEPDPCCEVDGLIAHVPNGDWSTLDYRESAYDRINIKHVISHPKLETINVAMYSLPNDRHSQPTGEQPVLLSYIDTVVQGYNREFGERGVENFFNTTSGWTAPILDDRQRPIYPRHQKLSPRETALIDANLRRIGNTPVNLSKGDSATWLGACA